MIATTAVVVHPGSRAAVGEALGAVPGIDVRSPMSEQDLLAALREAEVLVTTRPDWRDAYLQAGGLRWVQSRSAGYEDFPLEEFRRRGIVLTTGSGLHVVCAEHAIGLLLCLLRDIHVAVADMRERRWRPHVAAELGGRTVVVAGLGAIGEAIVERLRPWDVRLIGLTRSPRAHAALLDDVRPLDELPSACAEASVLVLALPDVPETQRLVSAEVLDALGRGWLVNVARGAVVDEAALVERLADGRLLGAGLDVVEREPLPATSPLWEAPNVVCTPHMGGSSPRHGERFADLFAHNLQAFWGAAPWRNRIC